MGKPDDNSSNEAKYRVVWPLSRKAVAVADAARRLPDLNGKVVGELWDWNFRGDIIFPLVRQRLHERFPAARFVDYSNFENFHGPGAVAAAERLPDKLRAHGCDAVIIGIGA